MADVRSLLRSELASRKHSSTTNNSTSSRKRKAAEDLPEDHKKTKSQRPATRKNNENAPIEHEEYSLEADEVVEDLNEVSRDAQTTIPKVHFAEQVQVRELDSLADNQKEGDVHEERDFDEDEWAAFEAGIAEASNATGAASEELPTTTISAAPISAEELAARAREQESRPKKGRRDEEMEEEKEDARRALEEEFDEMDELEERVKKLRERREALRGGVNNSNLAQVEPGTESNPATGEVKASDDSDAQDESDEEDDDWDWGRR